MSNETPNGAEQALGGWCAGFMMGVGAGCGWYVFAMLARAIGIAP